MKCVGQLLQLHFVCLGVLYAYETSPVPGTDSKLQVCENRTLWKVPEPTKG